jgi:hypothetical protein
MFPPEPYLLRVWAPHARSAPLPTKPIQSRACSLRLHHLHGTPDMVVLA